MSEKFRVEAAGKDGWTGWVSPLHGSGNRNYKAKCCKCGLVHEVQFRVFMDNRGRKSVRFRARLLPMMCEDQLPADMSDDDSR